MYNLILILSNCIGKVCIYNFFFLLYLDYFLHRGFEICTAGVRPLRLTSTITEIVTYMIVIFRQILIIMNIYN